MGSRLQFKIVEQSMKINKLMNAIILTKIMLLLSIIFSYSQSTPTYTWQQISGNWSVVSDNKESYLRENRGKSYTFNYSPLINLNSLISNSEYDFTSITHTVAIYAPADGATYLTFFCCI